MDGWADWVGRGGKRRERERERERETGKEEIGVLAWERREPTD